MKKLSMIIALSLTVVAFAAAQGVAYFADVGTKSAWPVVITKLGVVEKPLGAKFNLDWNAFAGVNSQNRPMGGVALTYTAPFAKNVDFTFGPALLLNEGRVRGRGAIVGITARF